MGLGKQTTSRKCWFGRRCFLLLSLCHLKSPRLSVLNNLGSCAVLSCAVRSWREEALALRLYLLDYCWSLHNSRDGVPDPTAAWRNSPGERGVAAPARC